MLNYWKFVEFLIVFKDSDPSGKASKSCIITAHPQGRELSAVQGGEPLLVLDISESVAKMRVTQVRMCFFFLNF